MLTHQIRAVRIILGHICAEASFSLVFYIPRQLCYHVFMSEGLLAAPENRKINL